jgi:UDP-glucose 4-epimerase
MNQLMKNNPLTIFGDGGQSRAFSYVSDIAPVIANSVNIKAAQNQVFNIGADLQFTINELAIEVCKAMGKEGQIRYLEARNEVAHAYSSHEKAITVFGILKSTPLADGLKKMADWALKTGAKKSTTFNNIEIAEKLPSVWLE